MSSLSCIHCASTLCWQCQSRIHSAHEACGHKRDLIIIPMEMFKISSVNWFDVMYSKVLKTMTSPSRRVLSLRTTAEREVAYWSHWPQCPDMCWTVQRFLNKELVEQDIGGQLMRRGSSVGVANAYGLDDRGVGVPVSVGSKIFTSPYHPDQLWGLPSLLSNGYSGLFPRG
jgi:hypothetical protein